SLQYFLPCSTGQLQAGCAHFFFFSSAMTHASFGSTVSSWATEMPAEIGPGGRSYALPCRVSNAASHRGDVRRKMVGSGPNSSRKDRARTLPDMQASNYGGGHAEKPACRLLKFTAVLYIGDSAGWRPLGTTPRATLLRPTVTPPAKPAVESELTLAYRDVR